MTVRYNRHQHDWAGGRRQSGVTLIELLVVIVVIAIIMAISIPAFTGMGRGAGMRGAVAEITSTLALSRQWAITKREEVTFVYTQDTTQSTYAVYSVDVDNTTNIIQATNALAVGYGFTATPPLNESITFDTTGGLISGATDKTITILGQNMSRIISINALTGAINVRDN